MDALFGGQTSNQASSNNTNAINAAAGNEQHATNNALSYLSQWLGQNPSPVSGWGNIAAPVQYGGGQMIGGGATNSLGALTQQPATGTGSTGPFPIGNPILPPSQRQPQPQPQPIHPPSTRQPQPAPKPIMPPMQRLSAGSPGMPRQY